MKNKKGLIIGKFMPVHRGHIRLVEFGARHCDQLIVAVCSRPNEPIDGKLRYGWMKELFADNKNIKVVWVRKDLPQDKKPSRRASKIWSSYLKNRFGKVDIIFSSEIYGDYLAEYMEIVHGQFDLERKNVPVSATDIRNDPFGCWNYIPRTVRPYFVKKICIYGSESTGKSTLARELAKNYGTVWVPEFAREHIEKQNNKFSYKDMEKIGRGQLALEKMMIKKANRLLFCDTDSITTAIYSKHYFGKVPSLVKKLADKNRFDLYLFTKIDIPWVSDPLRDLGKERKEFEEIFQEELVKRKIPFVIVRGKYKNRLKSAIRAVENFLETNKAKI